MLQFGRDLGRRGVPDENLGERLSADPSLMQLLPLMALRAEAGSSGLAAHRAARGAQARAFLRHALILCEIARRTGEIETLGRAASSILRARDLAKGDKRLMVDAVLQHATVLSHAAILFGDAEADEAVRQRLDEAEAHFREPLAQARLDALRAGLLARDVLAARNAAGFNAAVSALEASAKALDVFAKLGKVDESEVHEVCCDLAELMIGVGYEAKDRHKLDLALDVLNTLSAVLDAAYRPLTWARAEILRGQALAAFGDLAGDAASIAQGSAVLTTVTTEIPAEHSPLDAARAGHALGLVLQSLGEVCDEDALFDRALAAFAPALDAVDTATRLPLRAVVAHDSAACLARRAERRGDLAALEKAEAAFRDTLKTHSAAADPLSWAVTQVALARIYEAEAELRGDTGERADAAFALASALEIFSERGLRSLSDMALRALERVKAPA